MAKLHPTLPPKFTLKKLWPLKLARPLCVLVSLRAIQRGPWLKVGPMLPRAIPLNAPYFTRCRGNLKEWPLITLVQRLLLVLKPTLLKKTLHTAGRTLILGPPVRITNRRRVKVLSEDTVTSTVVKTPVPSTPSRHRRPAGPPTPSRTTCTMH